MKEFNLEVVIPNEENQEYVMESIYSRLGVKAGFTDGYCKEFILRAVDFLTSEGADVVILGCSELPLMFTNENGGIKNGKKIALVDPTVILARQVVTLSKNFRRAH